VASESSIDGARIGYGETAAPRAASRLTIRQRIFRMLCAIKGHDMALHLERKSLRLRCLSCGSESRGWDLPLRRLQGTRPADERRQIAEPRRHVVDSRADAGVAADHAAVTRPAARRTA
jgi:hypothetical protein